MGTTLRLVSEMERIANALGRERGDGSQVSLSPLAEKIAKHLGVRTEEVAILAISTRWRHLYFCSALQQFSFGGTHRSR